MSDNKLVLSKPIFNASSYRTADAIGKRIHAVSAALELIAARVSSAPSNGTHLDEEMKKLSLYADKIQAAIEK